MRIRHSINPYFIMVTLYVFWAICGYGSIANHLATLFCFIFLILDICKRQTLKYSLNSEIDKAILCFVLFFAYYFITSIINTRDFVYWAGNVIVYMFVSFYPLLIYRDVEIKKNINRTKRLLIAILSAWIPIVLYSTIYFIMHPGIAREAIVYQTKFDHLFIGNGYALAYGSAVLSVYLFAHLKKKNIRGKYAFGTWGFVLLSCIHVILTKSTLTTIWMVLGFILTFFLEKSSTEHDHNKRNTYILIMVLLFTALFFIFRENIGSILMSWGSSSSESLYSKRIYELGTVIKGNVVLKRHTLDRLSRPLMSFEVFCSSPVFGIGYKAGYYFDGMEALGLGNHSEIIDSMAKYGIAGFMPLVGVFFHVIRGVQKNDYPNESKFWVVTLVGMMFFNPFISMQSLMALFLIIPTISQVVKTSEIVQS